MEKICKGCGAKLQAERPADYGYAPAHLLEKESILCRRCHRISHYGKDEVGPVAADQSLKAIRKGVRWADGVVLVVDLMDFEAGFPQELLDLVQNRKLLITINKIDLLPKQTPLWEVERWARRRLKSFGLRGAGLELISALNGYGFPKLADRLTGFGPRVLFAGIVNVGKSNVISRLLKMRIGGGRRADIKPTVSAYPGTTVEYSRWQCPNGLTLADSPGYVASGRLSELACPECGRKLTPARPLAGKLQPIKAGEVLAVFGLAAVECLKGDGLLMGYSAAALEWRKAKREQLAQVLGPGHFHCTIDRWEKKEVSLAQFNDLVIPGLGWVSARKSDYKLRVHYPRGVRVLRRPNLIGPKK